MPTVYNIQRWTGALRDIYVKVRLGMDKTAASNLITNEWDKKERVNFSYWMKFYESNESSKYAVAQTGFYVNENAGYFLPNSGPPQEHAGSYSGIPDVSTIKEEADNIATRIAPGLSKEDEAKANEDFRRKLISRLNSLEKHLGSAQGYRFAGHEFDNILDSIFKLKKQIQTHNKLAAQTCIDLIIKHANILMRKNCPTASLVMVKVAQEMPTGGMDIAVPPALPAGPPGMPPAALPTGEEKEDVKTGLEGFLANLEGAGITDDDNDADDVEFEDEIELEAEDAFGELVVMAQNAVPEPPPREEPAPVSSKPAEPALGKGNFDALVDSAFNHLTVNDLIAKLNDIDLIFKKREISNQLALGSVMLAKLGLTHYFPEYSELQQKQLEATTYSATRMQTILTALRGGVGQSKIDLTSPTNPNDPEAQLLSRHLENEEKKDQDAKAVKKQVEQQQAENLSKPSIEVESPAEELANPTPSAPPTSAPVRRPITPAGA